MAVTTIAKEVVGPNKLRLMLRSKIPVLVERARDGSEAAARELADLAFENDENQVAMVAAGAIPVLVDLLGSEARVEAAWALANLAVNASIDMKASVPGLAKLALEGRDEEARVEAARALAILAFNDSRVAIDAMPAFLDLAKTGESSRARDLVADALAHVGAETGDFSSAIPVLVDLLRDSRDQAAVALQSLALANPDNQKMIVDAGALPTLVDLSERGNKDAVGALANLAHNNADNQKAIAAAGAIPALVELLASKDACEIAAGAVANLAALEDNRSIILESGAIPGLLDIVACGTDEAKEFAAGALANLALQDDVFFHPDALVDLATRGTDGAKVEAAWALANLAVNNPQITGLVVPVLLDLARDDNPVAKHEATLALRTLGFS
ncbi:hypothetical protein CTAYLR_009769 [Chrysophaeum taylorii]|uniref:Uncharacterized protein n=1 Tax=Chrysophaeum taylorii TaxID=2483200 RepID=A0AAD7UL15_9STRA|nr:hypothetical protein CTAYLR_009769 [Chrysophaeum taylorii]